MNRGWISFPIFPGFWITLPVPVRAILLGLLTLGGAVLVFIVLGALLLSYSDGFRTSFPPTDRELLLNQR